MNCDPQRHNRRSMRLKGYDYSSSGGKITRGEWLRTEAIRDEESLDAFVIMPNHLHGPSAIYHLPTEPF